MTTGRLSAAIAQVVRAEIAARDWTPAEFARRVDMPKTTAWRRVNGETSIDTDELDTFADVFGWTAQELIRRASETRDEGHIYVTKAAQRRKSARKGEDD